MPSQRSGQMEGSSHGATGQVVVTAVAWKPSCERCGTSKAKTEPPNMGCKFDVICKDEEDEYTIN